MRDTCTHTMLLCPTADFLEAVRVEPKWQKVANFNRHEVEALLAGAPGSICRIRLRRLSQEGAAVTFDCALERLAAPPPTSKKGVAAEAPQGNSARTATNSDKIDMKTTTEVSAANANERICQAMARVNSGHRATPSNSNKMTPEELKAWTAAREQERLNTQPLSGEDIALARGRSVVVCEDDNHASGWRMWMKFLLVRLAERWGCGTKQVCACGCARAL